MALRIQRTQSLEPRLEITPLLDVVFLLLAFFIYAMVLLIRAEILPVQLPELSNADGAKPSPAVAITVNAAGTLFLDGQEVAMQAVVERLKERLAETPDARVYVAASTDGQGDRLPIFIELVNQLRGSGIKEFFIVGQPTDSGAGREN
jgi:biopolymer transport protein ExbD